MSLQPPPPASPLFLVPANPPIHRDALFEIYRLDNGALSVFWTKTGKAIDGLGFDLVIQRLASTLWSESARNFEVASGGARCFVFTRQRVSWCIEEVRCEMEQRVFLRRCSSSDYRAILTALVSEIERPTPQAARIEAVARG